MFLQLETQEALDIHRVFELLKGKLEDWLTSGVSMLPNFVVALLLLICFALLGKVLKKLFIRLFARVTDNPSLIDLVGSVIYILVISIGTFVALSILHLDGAVTSLLAGAGVVGLALSFAFQEIASNFIAGTMMSIKKPFQEGDLIEVDGFYGKVLQIQLRTTDIETLQGQHVMIPNAQIFKSNLTNYSTKQKRRIDLEVGVHYDTDLELAKKVAIDAVSAMENIEKESVRAFYNSFGDSSINFLIWTWIPFNNNEAEFLAIQDEMVIRIKKAFDAHNITIPYPMRTLDFGEVNFPKIFNEAGLNKS